MATMLNGGAGFGDLTPLVNADWVVWYLDSDHARVYKLCRESLIPHVRLGRSVRFSREDVIAWTESGGSAYPGGWRKEVE